MLTTAFLGALLQLASVPEAAADDRTSISASSLEGLAASSPCRALRSRYSGLPGRNLTIGLGGYGQGFEMPDAANPSHIIGLDPDMYDAVDACLGTTHHFLVTSFTILVASIGSGRVDIGSLLYVTPERARRVAFVSVMQVTDGSIIRRDGPALRDLNDLCGQVVGAPAGTYEAVTVIPRQSGQCLAAHRSPVTMLLVQNTDAAVEALRTSRVAIVFTARPQAVAITTSDPDLKLGFTLGLPITAGYPLARSNMMLSKAVCEALRIVQSSGIQRQALLRWGLDAAAERPALLID